MSKLSDEDLKRFASENNTRKYYDHNDSTIIFEMARELLELRAKERIHQMTEAEAFITLGKLAAAEKVVETLRVVIKEDGCVGKGPCMNATCMALDAYDKVVKND